MNRASHIGIVLAAVAHMLCGCCLHHVHASGPRTDLPLSVDATRPCDEHHGHQHEGQFCDHSSEHHQCDGGRCVFTRADSDDTPDLSIGHGCLNPVCVLPGTSALRGIDRVDSSLGEPGALIPLHLLNQALLL